jgi:hypothetical protein
LAALGTGSAAGAGLAPERRTPPLLGWPFTALSARARLALLSLAAGVIILAGVVGARVYPRSGPAKPSDLERQIAAFTHDPTVASWDDAIVGDLLVERFYILDLNSGDHYVADFLKGRIYGVEVVQQEDQPPANVLLLDTKEMRRDKNFYAAYITSVSHPQDRVDAFYLGVVTPTGNTDAFPVNYNGQVPAYREAFRQGDETDVYSYMLSQKYSDVTGPRPLNVGGTVYVLNSSDAFPLFKNEYRLDKALFVSELLTIDTTSRPNKETYFKLLDKFPRSAGN